MTLDHLAECLASGSESQRAHAEVFEVMVGTAGFLAGQAAEAAVDGLTPEAAAVSWTSATMSLRANSVARAA